MRSPDQCSGWVDAASLTRQLNEVATDDHALDLSGALDDGLFLGSGRLAPQTRQPSGSYMVPQHAGGDRKELMMTKSCGLILLHLKVDAGALGIAVSPGHGHMRIIVPGWINFWSTMFA